MNNNQNFQPNPYQYQPQYNPQPNFYPQQNYQPQYNPQQQQNQCPNNNNNNNNNKNQRYFYHPQDKNLNDIPTDVLFCPATSYGYNLDILINTGSYRNIISKQFLDKTD